MRTVFSADLGGHDWGYIVCYIGNVNKDMTAQNRGTWWIVPGTLSLED
jgi:hypothetical protein